MHVCDTCVRHMELHVPLAACLLLHRLGDVVGTFAWNTTRHLEAWYGVMGLGAICHTLNPRLSDRDITYIAGVVDLIDGCWAREIRQQQRHRPACRMALACDARLLLALSWRCIWRCLGGRQQGRVVSGWKHCQISAAACHTLSACHAMLCCAVLHHTILCLCCRPWGGQVHSG